MNISPIALCAPYFLISNNLQANNTSFKGNNDIEVSKNTKESLFVAEKMLKIKPNDLTIDKIRRFFDIHLLPVSKAPHIKTEVAVMDYKMPLETGEIDKKTITIFVPDVKVTNKMSKTIFVMNLAHEYTHARQILNGEDANQDLYKKVKEAGIPLEAFSQIHETAFACYSAIGGNIMRMAMEKVLGKEGEQSYKTTGGLVLLNRNISDDQIAQAIGFSSADIMKKNFIKSVDVFERFALRLCRNVPAIKNMYISNPTRTISLISELLIEYCKNSSRQEKEAYLTENIIAKKQGFEDKGSELAYKYHKLIEETFS